MSNSLETYNDSWEKPHTPTDEVDWQESDWFMTYDPKAGIGVTFRIGMEPNKGTSNHNLTVWTPDGNEFELSDHGGRGDDVKLEPDSITETGATSGGNSVEFIGNGRLRFIWNYERSKGDVVFTNSYEPRYWTLDGSCSDTLRTIQHPVSEHGGHLESGGRIVGKVSFDGIDYEVDSPGHRDRSWGNRPRYFERLAWFKFLVGDIGPELAFAAQVTQPRVGPDDPLVGFVVRNGKTDELADIRVIGKIDLDAGRALGATAFLTVESGEVIEIEITFAKPSWVASGEGAFSGVGTIERDGAVGSCFLVYSGDLTKKYT